MSEDQAHALSGFIDWVDEFLVGDEKGEAQIFLDRLFKAFGLGGVREAGGHLETRVKKSGPRGTSTGFADYVLKPVVLIEMKKRGENLRKHQPQAFRYWAHLVPNRPRWVVLCNFDEFWVYDFDTQIDEPMDVVSLEDLPKRHTVLAFLRPGNPAPTFKHDIEGVTRQAADMLAAVFNSLVDRGTDREEAQRFTLQCLVALFAEDIDLLPKHFFSHLIDDCKSPAASYDLIGGLFEQMNRTRPATGGRYKGVRYFNGGLFSEPISVELIAEEIDLLRSAARYSWDLVRPEVFGTIFEHSMDKVRQHALGAHFTSAVDIMKIVEPTIVAPWSDAIGAARTQRELHALRRRLASFRVLDPACGSGNFLYVAYREMKRLEARILSRIGELSKRAPTGQLDIGFVDASQFFGIDTDPFAIDMAKVTMMIARKLAIDELALPEQALPLDNLDQNFVTGDALIDDDSKRAWPPADVVIGNPPFLGAKRLLGAHGAEYLGRLRAAYAETSEMVDYCTYWFQRAHDHLPECTTNDPFSGRAGLVATQNIRFGDSSEFGPGYVCGSGGEIIEALDNHPWSGEANVNVSIINWVKPASDSASVLPTSRKLWTYSDNELQYSELPTISPELSSKTDTRSAIRLDCNDLVKVCFQGVTTGTTRFLFSPARVRELPDAEKTVLRPFLGASELTKGGVRRWAIDLTDSSLMEAKRHKTIFAHCEHEILPLMQQRLREAEDKGKQNDINARTAHLDQWWRYWRVRDDMRESTRALDRCLACPRHGRYHILRFVDPEILLGDALQVFAFADDYSFGILQSSAHESWWKKSSRLKNEEDVRYSEKKVFATFPWPQHPKDKHVEAVVSAARQVQSARISALDELGTTHLASVYKALSTPGKSDLRDAHDDLNAAVRVAYGFKKTSDLLTDLLSTNHDVAARIKNSDPVTTPGPPEGLAHEDPVPGSTYEAPPMPD